jgi:hypothetical protein
MGWDDDDSDWMDGFLTGFILFDNNKSPFGFILLLIIIVVILICLDNT